MEEGFVKNLVHSKKNVDKLGLFFEAHFDLDEIGDTYFDLSNFKKGYVFVNDRNLGRYWNIGP